MRFLKLAAISVIVLFIVITAISTLLPSSVLVSRAVDIKSPANKIRSELFSLSNWQYWMTDAKGDKGEHVYDSVTASLMIGPTKVKALQYTDTTFKTLWSSSSPMQGTFRIIDHHRADSLHTVQWQMEQKVRWYPWEKFASITKDELWGGSMEKSLENLKVLVESR